MMTTAIDRIEKHAERIASGEHETLRPGMPMRFPEATSVGEFVWQGDLKFTLVAEVPDDYALQKVSNKQLVPGETQGARHCLDSLDGVGIFLPPEWPTGLRGPCLVLAKERVIEHPTHGHVTIPAGLTILCSCQREWDQEQRVARRNAD